MSKVLYIKANPKSNEASRTFRISEKFIESYKKSHPQDEIITLDLYKEGIHFLTLEDINSVFGPKTEESKNHPILKYAYQFASVDKYVIAAPMWNLSIPAILKAYIDYVSVTGITFRYTAQGPVGLMENKKAIHIIATGGEYFGGPGFAYEMGNRYLNTILGFFGITDVELIAAQKLDVVGEDVEGIMANAIKDAQQKAESF